jgi:hypothetical protein
MYSENQRKVEKKAKAEKYKLKKQLGTNKISARDYANRVKAVEKWVTKKKETLKNTNNECGKQINQIIEKMHYSPGKDSKRDSRPNFSAYLNDISMDSIVNNSRLLPSDKKSSKKAMTSRIDPLCLIDNSLLHSAKKGNLENSTVSLNDPNSYLWTDRESKLHTKSNINYLNKESSVKKDKYWYAIKPFEYKLSYVEEDKIKDIESCRDGTVNKEIVILDSNEQQREEAIQEYYKEGKSSGYDSPQKSVSFWVFIAYLEYWWLEL